MAKKAPEIDVKTRKQLYTGSRGRGIARHYLRIKHDGMVLLEVECDKGSATDRNLLRLIADANRGAA